MNAQDVLKYGQRTALAAIDGFPEASLDAPGACGTWSVKDIIAHLASYEEVLIDILSGFLGSHPTPSLDRYIELGERFNDVEVEKRRGKTARELLDEFNEAHAKVMETAAGISPEVFRQVGTLPWYGAVYALDDMLVYMYYGHKREHSAQIAAFGDRL